MKLVKFIRILLMLFLVNVDDGTVPLELVSALIHDSLQ